jgi:ABC-2 type transport system ATP-binding protein
VRETVELFASYYPKPRDVDEVIDVVGLSEKRHARVKRLSGGQHRRLDVAVALAGDPQLLFLDEPTTGFDPGARRQAWEIVRNLTGLGKTVFLTTHYMDEASALANRVAVIAKGEIVAEGPPSTLGGRDVANSVITYRVDGQAPPTDLAGTRLADGSFELRTPEPTVALHRLTGWAIERHAMLQGLEVRRPSLEDVYLELTGGEGGSE